MIYYHLNDKDGYHQDTILELVVPEKKKDKLEEIKQKLGLIQKLLQIRKKKL